MATEQNKQELRDKLAVLVGATLGGDYRAAFARYADRNRKAGTNGVKVNDSKVVLRGTVRSWAERDEAQRAAWGPGVMTVENQLGVTA